MPMIRVAPIRGRVLAGFFDLPRNAGLAARLGIEVSADAAGITTITGGLDVVTEILGEILIAQGVPEGAVAEIVETIINYEAAAAAEPARPTVH